MALRPLEELHRPAHTPLIQNISTDSIVGRGGDSPEIGIGILGGTWRWGWGGAVAKTPPECTGTIFEGAVGFFGGIFDAKFRGVKFGLSSGQSRVFV